MTIDYGIDPKVNPADAMKMLKKASGHLAVGFRQIAVALAEANVRDAFELPAGRKREVTIRSALDVRRRVREAQLDQLARMAEENVRLAGQLEQGRHRAVKHARDARRHLRTMEIKHRGWK